MSSPTSSSKRASYSLAVSSSSMSCPFGWCGPKERPLWRGRTQTAWVGFLARRRVMPSEPRGAGVTSVAPLIDVVGRTIRLPAADRKLMRAPNKEPA